MLPYLEKDIANLVSNAQPLHDLFVAIAGGLSQYLLYVLSPTSFIEGYAPRVIKARHRLADHEAQDNQDAQEEANK